MHYSFLSNALRTSTSQQLTGIELPPWMPWISPALVTVVPGTAVAKDIPAGYTIIPG